MAKKIVCSKMLRSGALLLLRTWRQMAVYTPNPFGLHDMAGNVQEWCYDIWISYYDFDLEIFIDVTPGESLRQIPNGAIRWNRLSLMSISFRRRAISWYARASSAFCRVLVDFRFNPKTQALVKAAEAREMVCMKADLMQDGHCRGTGIAKLSVIELLRINGENPFRGIV